MTYAELIAQRTQLCDTLRNSPISQINSEYQRNLRAEIACINVQLINIEVVNTNPF